MSLQERRQQEQKELVDKRKSEVITSAVSCFSEKGIETSSIADISKRAQVGEATIYRYFGTKENLALECGKCFWIKASQKYEELSKTGEYQSASGIRQIELLLQLTGGMFQKNRESFHFLHDLDVFLVTHQSVILTKEAETFSEYEKLVDLEKPLLINAIQKGKTDGSITEKAENLELYYTITHTVLSLMEKMAGIGEILPGDSIVKEQRRISLLIELLLKGLQ